MTGATGATAGARAHARAQGGTVVECMPTVPATATAVLGGAPRQEDLVWAETIAAGSYAAKVLARGTTLRLTDLAGDACAHVLLFNVDQPWERLNVADTVKVLWQAYLGIGHLLLSDQGRVLASLVRDTSAHHDALCGTSSRLHNENRYGDGSPEGPSPAGRELFVLAGAKHGLDRRDIGPSVSFFKGHRVDASGAFSSTGSAGAGAHVELRAELPLVVLVANVPHPLDDRDAYTCSPLQVRAWRGAPTSPADPLWRASPETERAFRNTTDYADARGLR